MRLEYGEKRQNRFKIIVEAYQNKIDVNIPETFVLTDGSKIIPGSILSIRKKLSKPIDSSSSNYNTSWKNSALVNKAGYLHICADAFIQAICTFQVSHGKHHEEPENVFLEEFKDWAAELTKVSIFEKKHIEKCNARIAYINKLKNNSALPNYFSVEGSLLNDLAKCIRNRIIPQIETKINEHNLSAITEHIANNLKTVISDIILYLFRIIRSSRGVPSNLSVLNFYQGIDNGTKPFASLLTNNRSGRLLKIVLNNKLVREALHPQDNRSRTTESEPEVPLLSDDGKPCIPLSCFFGSQASPSVRNTSDIGRILGGNLVPDRAMWRRFFSGIHSGIESGFQQNKEALDAFCSLNAIVIELARTYEMINCVHQISVQSGNIGIVATSKMITGRILAPAHRILATANKLILDLNGFVDTRDEDTKRKRRYQAWQKCQSLAIDESTICMEYIQDIHSSLTELKTYLKKADLAQMRRDHSNMIEEVTNKVSAYVNHFNTRLSKLTACQKDSKPIAVPDQGNPAADDSETVSMSPGGPVFPLRDVVGSSSSANKDSDIEAAGPSSPRFGYY